MKQFLFVSLLLVFFSGCVSSRHETAAQAVYSPVDNELQVVITFKSESYQ